MLFKKLLLRFKDDIYLWLVLGLGFLMRVWGIGFGLPYLYQADEGNMLYTTFYAAANWLRPESFIHSVLISYFLLPIYGFYYLVGTILGIFSSPLELYISFLEDPTLMIILGRIALVVVSMATVLITFIIGKRFFNEKVGILGAFFLSFTFLFVKESHYIKDEVLAAFFVALFFYFTLLVLTKARSRDYLWSGIFFGLSVSAKYIYAPIFLTLIIASYFGGKRFKLVLISVGAALFSFFISNPYTLLDFPNFLEQIKGLWFEHRMIGPALIEGRSVWLSFLVEHLPQGMGWPSFFITTVGFIWVFLDTRKKKGILLGLTTVLLFFGVIIGGGNFPRWVVPLFPLMSLMGGIALERIFKGKKAAITLLAFLIVLPSFVRIVKFNKLITWPDTRSLAKHWVEDHIPAGTKIAIEGTTRDDIVSHLGPPLILEQRRWFEILESIEREQSRQKVMAQIKVFEDQVSYDLIGVPRLDRYYDVNKDRHVEIGNVDFYSEKGVEYLIRTSWANREGVGVSEEFEKSILRDYLLLKEFHPTVLMKHEPHGWRMDYQALDSVPFFGGGVGGPVISIYRFKIQ